ncbi:MAG: hypothetical protein LCI00_23345 [Chloroflexi bacterium]|nr:hypothetical protein [Chloroflexota bacterium]MCC6895990.1 hypothetical protein [Anaerolineae bacterium]
MNISQIPKPSDDQLWAVVNESFPLPKDLRLHELMMIGKQGSLSAIEQAELETLIEEHDQYILLRSQALLILKQRGFDVGA